MALTHVNKVLMCLFATSSVIAVEKSEHYARDGAIIDVLCPGASLNYGSQETMSKCAVRCATSSSCTSFFYNNNEQLCKGSETLIASDAGCELKTGTHYYKATDAQTTTSTTTTTSSSFIRNYGDVCMSPADCSQTNTVCYFGECTCEAGYSYHPGTGACVISCAMYGDSYLGYKDMELDVPFTQYTILTLEVCKAHCTASSTCRGFNYMEFSGGMCRLKSATPLTNPTDFYSLSGINYYSRNCE